MSKYLLLIGHFCTRCIPSSNAHLVENSHQLKPHSLHFFFSFVPARFRQHNGTEDDTNRILEDMVGDTNQTFAPIAGVERKQKVVKHGDDVCAGCGKSIVGRVVSAMDKTWHPDWYGFLLQPDSKLLCFG